MDYPIAGKEGNMENGFLATLSPKGQLTLPKEIRKDLRLEKGGTVLVEKAGAGVLLRSVEIRPRGDDFDDQEWEALRKIAREKKGRPQKTVKGFLKSLESGK